MKKKTLKYGVFAVLQSRLGNNDVFAEDGTLTKMKNISSFHITIL